MTIRWNKTDNIWIKALRSRKKPVDLTTDNDSTHEDEHTTVTGRKGCFDIQIQY